ncbi:hypothetical protein JW992_10275 [candidate division KSB1 bacterium]|nr:hypothetical protein [candidate division KSB1 bacterium]
MYTEEGYRDAQFESGSDGGSAKTHYSFSSGFTLFTELPVDYRLLGGGSKSVNDKLVYEYSLFCSQETWERAGQAALLWGRAEGVKKIFVLLRFDGDSTFIVTLPNSPIELMYTFGKRLSPHNPIVLLVAMQIQRQLGCFRPYEGDRVFVLVNLRVIVGWMSSAGTTRLPMSMKRRSILPPHRSTAPSPTAL